MLSREAWRRLGSIVLIPALLAVALLTWALASPLGSSPDEDYHLNSIWCGQGLRPGLCEAGPEADERLTPAALTAAACFRFDTSITAGCQNLADTHMKATKRVNVAHSYPPVYYAAMSIFAGHDIVRSVLIIRLVNVLIFTLLLAALYWLLPPPRRSTLVLSWAVTIVPLSAFLIASVNPSGWTIMGCGTAWLAALGFFETRGRQRVGLAVLALVGAVLAAGSRADGAIYVALSVAIAAVIGLELGRKFWRPRVLWLPIAVAVVAIVAFLTSRQGSATVSGVSSVSTGGGANPQYSGLGLLFQNVLGLPWLWTGAIGNGPLGWLDTPMPALVSTVGVFAFGSLLFYGLRALDWRKAASVALVLFCLIVIPLYTLQISHDRVGENLQPRYMLPLMIQLAGLASLAVVHRRVDLAPLHRVILVVVLAISNSAALYTNMQRYIHVGSNLGFDLDHDEGWWWHEHVPSPMIMWIIGSLAFAGAIVAAVLWTPALPLTRVFTREQLSPSELPDGTGAAPMTDASAPAEGERLSARGAA